jgi:hypothetical protein
MDIELLLVSGQVWATNAVWHVMDMLEGDLARLLLVGFLRPAIDLPEALHFRQENLFKMFTLGSYQFRNPMYRKVFITVCCYHRSSAYQPGFVAKHWLLAVLMIFA